MGLDFNSVPKTFFGHKIPFTKGDDKPAAVAPPPPPPRPPEPEPPRAPPVAETRPAPPEPPKEEPKPGKSEGERLEASRTTAQESKSKAATLRSKADEATKKPEATRNPAEAAAAQSAVAEADKAQGAADSDMAMFTTRTLAADTSRNDDEARKARLYIRMVDTGTDALEADEQARQATVKAEQAGRSGVREVEAAVQARQHAAELHVAADQAKLGWNENALNDKTLVLGELDRRIDATPNLNSNNADPAQRAELGANLGNRRVVRAEIEVIRRENEVLTANIALAGLQAGGAEGSKLTGAGNKVEKLAKELDEATQAMTSARASAEARNVWLGQAAAASESLISLKADIEARTEALKAPGLSEAARATLNQELDTALRTQAQAAKNQDAGSAAWNSVQKEFELFRAENGGGGIDGASQAFKKAEEEAGKRVAEATAGIERGLQVQGLRDGLGEITETVEQASALRVEAGAAFESASAADKGQAKEKYDVALRAEEWAKAGLTAANMTISADDAATRQLRTGNSLVRELDRGNTSLPSGDERDKLGKAVDEGWKAADAALAKVDSIEMEMEVARGARARQTAAGEGLRTITQKLDAARAQNATSDTVRDLEDALRVSKADQDVADRSVQWADRSFERLALGVTAPPPRAVRPPAGQLAGPPTGTIPQDDSATIKFQSSYSAAVENESKAMIGLLASVDRRVELVAEIDVERAQADVDATQISIAQLRGKQAFTPTGTTVPTVPIPLANSVLANSLDGDLVAASRVLYTAKDSQKTLREQLHPETKGNALLSVLEVIGGVVVTAGGATIAGVGGLASSTGVAAPVGVPAAVGGGALASYGAANVAHGVEQLAGGYRSETYQSRLLQAAGVDKNVANKADAYFGQAAQALATVGLAGALRTGTATVVEGTGKPAVVGFSAPLIRQGGGIVRVPTPKTIGVSAAQLEMAPLLARTIGNPGFVGFSATYGGLGSGLTAAAQGRDGGQVAWSAAWGFVGAGVASVPAIVVWMRSPTAIRVASDGGTTPVLMTRGGLAVEARTLTLQGNVPATIATNFAGSGANGALQGGVVGPLLRGEELSQEGAVRGFWSALASSTSGAAIATNLRWGQGNFFTPGAVLRPAPPPVAVPAPPAVAILVNLNYASGYAIGAAGLATRLTGVALFDHAPIVPPAENQAALQDAVGP